MKKYVVESHIFLHSPLLAFPLRGRGTALAVDEVARRQEFSSSSATSSVSLRPQAIDNEADGNSGKYDVWFIGFSYTGFSVLMTI